MLTIKYPATRSMVGMNRRRSQGGGKDDGHYTGKQHTGPSDSARQAVRDPGIDEGGNNSNNVDLVHVSKACFYSREAELTPRGIMLISGTVKTMGFPFTL